MVSRDEYLDRLYREADAGLLTRRQILVAAVALGVAVPAIGPLLAKAQDATPAATPVAPTSPAANGPVNVPIVGKT